MKTLIVYFSLEGNTEYVADMMSKEIGADLLRLIPKKAYHDKGWWQECCDGREAGT